MSLLRRAQRCLLNIDKYAHLNAFINRVTLDVLKHQAEQYAKEGPKLGGQFVPDHGNPNVRWKDRGAKGRLVAIKDNICTQDLPTTAASGILRTYTSPYDATVVEKLRKGAGALICGKTNLDEFGMGSHSVNSHFGPVLQQQRPTRQGEFLSAGGSSGGSAVAVATNQCWAALGTDTGGSVRLPAAYTGTIGFKPSYGLVSRWGVIAYANSLDTVGVFARYSHNVRELFKHINCHDKKDPTSLDPQTRRTIDENAVRLETSRRLRIGVPSEYNIGELSPEVRAAWVLTLQRLVEHGKACNQARRKDVEIVPVSLPTTQQALSAYYVLAPAEASSNLAKYDGVRYGSRATDAQSDAPPGSVLFAQTRGEGFGDEVKRRILLGAYTLSATAIDNYFIQAQKVRRLVQRDFDRVFAAANPLLIEEVDMAAHTTRAKDSGAVDVLIHPTAPTLPPTIEAVKEQSPLEGYVNDVFTVPASLAGLPAVSVPVPCGAQGVCGMQIVGQFGQDGMVLDVADMLEEAFKPEIYIRLERRGDIQDEDGLDESSRLV